MAKRQITIDDGSKGRNQVALNLNPVALTPTVNRNGGNYRVAVQQTPLTNSAMQLSSLLKEGVNAYGKAVEIGTKKGTEDAANMSDEDYDKFLQKGLDPEAKSLFGHTKAYNRKLSERYYATEIPTKLAALSSDMFKNYYDYKDPAAFEAALEARTGEVYAEADELLGGNVFGEQANNVLKAATRANFIGNEVEKFNRELPRRNQEMATETIGRQIAEVDETNIDSLFTIATKAFDGNVGILGKRAASAAVFSSVQTRLETLIASDSSLDHDLADAIFDEIGGGKDEEKLVAGQELFATPERQLKLSELEKKLETRVDGSFRDAQQDAAVYSNAIQADLIGIDDEDKAKIVLDAKIKELHSSGSLDGVSLENQKAVDMLIIDLNKLKSNPYLFRKEHKANYIRQTSIQQEVMNDKVEIFLDSDMQTGAGVYMKNVSVTSVAKGELTDQGRELMAAYNLKKEQMYSALLESVSKIKDDEERRLAFVDKETNELLPAMKEWFDTTTNNAGVDAKKVTNAEVTANATIVGVQRVAELETILGENAAAVIAIEAAEIKDDETDKLTVENRDGVTYPAGRSPDRRRENFLKLKKMRTLSEEDLYSSHTVVYQDAWKNKNLTVGWNGRTQIPSEADKFILGMIPLKNGRPRAGGYYSKEVAAVFKPELEQKLTKGTQLFNLMTVAGIPAEHLVSGYIPLGANAQQQGQVSIEWMQQFNLFNLMEVPIILEGSIQNTVNAVTAWRDSGMTLETLDPKHRGTLNKIAEKHEMSMNELLISQKTYLTENGYLEN